MPPCRIILVEDESSLLEVMEMYLARLGYEVVACRSGEDAWQRFEASPSAFGLVLTDIVLPKMSGEEMLRRMLALHPDLRILICSGYPFDVNSLGAPAGNVEFLQKPFAPTALAHALEGLLGPGK